MRRCPTPAVVDSAFSVQSLGSTDVRVTRLGLGTGPIGRPYEDAATRAPQETVERAWELGIRFFDTAPYYGEGRAERLLGEALRVYPRDEAVFATKVGRLIRPDAAGEPQAVFDFSSDATLRSLEESLERLGLDRVDVLHIHDPDDHYDSARDECFPALARLRDEGVIGAIGVGMNQAEMLARFVRETGIDCVLLAGRYTILEQPGLEELLPLCVERGVSVIAAGVFNSGVLADPDGAPEYNYAPAPAEVVARARALAAVCARHGVTLKAAAIQFPLAHPAVATALVGCRSAAEIEEDVALLRTEVPGALWDDLKGEGLLAEDAPMPTPGSRP
jgi:D-threo-aldose 1-dehydrogenase